MPKKSESGKPRRAKTESYKNLRLQKPIKHPVKLLAVPQITKQSAQLLWQHRRLFIGITLIYGLINVLFVQSLSAGADVSSLKESFNQVSAGNLGFLASSLSTFAVLLGTAGNTTNQASGAYQTFLAVISSLAIIWALREVAADGRPRVRDAFYRGMSQLVPFILVLLVIGVQLLPLAIGTGLYSIVIDNGIAVYAVEKIIWALLGGGLALLTFYMLSSSLFALYIVTLPDMAPMQALRSARELVRYRRWTVLRKLLCLPLILLVGAAIITVPFIILLPPMAAWIFFLLTMFSLTAVHAYVYTLYRELLNE